MRLCILSTISSSQFKNKVVTFSTYSHLLLNRGPLCRTTKILRDKYRPKNSVLGRIVVIYCMYTNYKNKTRWEFGQRHITTLLAKSGFETLWNKRCSVVYAHLKLTWIQIYWLMKYTKSSCKTVSLQIPKRWSLGYSGLTASKADHLLIQCVHLLTQYSLTLSIWFFAI